MTCAIPVRLCFPNEPKLDLGRLSYSVNLSTFSGLHLGASYIIEGTQDSLVAGLLTVPPATPET